jgi:hypothetical protein
MVVHGRHEIANVTIVGDAGMISEANQHAIENAGLSFILGTVAKSRARPAARDPVCGR